MATTTIHSSMASGIPVGVSAPYRGGTIPSGWLLEYGQAVSRTTYALLFAAIGTTYGVGDGSTTFNLPDSRGYIDAGKDDMGGSAAGRLNVTLTGTRASTANGNITGLSSTAGLAVGMKAFGTGIGTNAVISSITSSTALTLSVNNTATGSASIRFGIVDGATLGAVGGSQVHTLTVGQLAVHDHPFTAMQSGAGSVGSPGGDLSSVAGTTSSAGGDQAHPNVQPTLISNKIIFAGA